MSGERPSRATDHSEEGRAFLQDRLGLYWKVLFFFFLIATAIGIKGPLADPGATCVATAQVRFRARLGSAGDPSPLLADAAVAFDERLTTPSDIVVSYPHPTVAQRVAAAVTELVDTRGDGLSALGGVGNAGFVSATRGTKGGYKLERPAERIRLIDVVEVFDPVRIRPACLMGQGECNDRHACAAHYAWKRVRGVYLEFLENTTLAAIAGSGGSVESFPPPGLLEVEA